MARQLKRSGNKKRVLKRRTQTLRRESVRAEYLESVDTDLINTVHQWRGVKRQLGYLGSQEETLKKKLKEAVHKSGYADAEGHLHIDFDEPIDGLVGILLQKRQGEKYLNEEKAKEILEELELYEECSEEVTERILNEDKILALHYEDEISEEDLADMYETPDVTWAFYGVDEKR